MRRTLCSREDGSTDCQRDRCRPRRHADQPVVGGRTRRASRIEALEGALNLNRRRLTPSSASALLSPDHADRELFLLRRSAYSLLLTSTSTSPLRPCSPTMENDLRNSSRELTPRPRKWIGQLHDAAVHKTSVELSSVFSFQSADEFAHGNFACTSWLASERQGVCGSPWRCHARIPACRPRTISAFSAPDSPDAFQSAGPIPMPGRRSRAAAVLAHRTAGTAWWVWRRLIPSTGVSNRWRGVASGRSRSSSAQAARISEVPRWWQSASNFLKDVAQSAGVHRKMLGSPATSA